MPQRRIVLYSPGWPPARFPNGIVTFVGGVRAPLKQLGYESCVLTGAGDRDNDPDAYLLRDTAPPPSLFQRVNERIRYAFDPSGTLSKRTGREVIGALKAIAKHYPIDLLEVEETWGFAEIVRRGMHPMPVVLRLHGPWFLNGPAVGVKQDADYERRLEAEREAIANATALTSPSQDVLDQTRKFYKLSLDNAEVIPSPGPLVPEDKRWSAASCKRNVILFVGRFDRHKGGDLVIDAFREVATNHPDVELWFVGPDRGFVDDAGRTFDMPTYLKEHLPDASMRERVKVMGQMKSAEIGDLRSQAFVTWFASRYENFSIAALEALAYGCPFIASDAGGTPEMMLPGKTALSFKAGDFKALAAQTERVLNEPNLAESLSEQALIDYAERFAPLAVAQVMIRYYERILAGKRR
jgi:glycosyltransferase involved in cell wall biosynthesis